VGVLAVFAMLATTAVTLLLLVYWINTWRHASRAGRRTGLAMLAANAVFWAPGIVLFATQPWGQRTDAAVFLIYIGLIALGLLALGAAYAARDIKDSRRRRQS
jgi:hypothetical protein